MPMKQRSLEGRVFSLIQHLNNKSGNPPQTPAKYYAEEGGLSAVLSLSLSCNLWELVGLAIYPVLPQGIVLKSSRGPYYEFDVYMYSLFRGPCYTFSFIYTYIYIHIYTYTYIFLLLRGPHYDLRYIPSLKAIGSSGYASIPRQPGPPPRRSSPPRPRGRARGSRARGLVR